MRPRSLLAAAVLLFVATTPALAGEGLTELARIQTGLNRVTAGSAPETELNDPLERVVAAFSVGWAAPDADPARAEPILQEVEAEIAQRSEALAPGYREHFSIDFGGYIAKLEAGAHASSDPLARLVLALHCIDAILIREHVKPWGLTYEKRDYVQFPSQGGLAIGAWLRVPCRTLPGREDAFRKAIAALGELAGPVLDCPGPGNASPDLSMSSRFARNPAAAANTVARRVIPVPVRPAPPVSPSSPPKGAWSHETAVVFMARDPRRAEVRLKQATTPAQKLDYALFLFAFHSPSHHRNLRIKRLLADIAGPEPGGPYGDSALTPSFDGSMQSMVRDLTIPAIYGAAPGDGTYAIPCAVLVRIPALLKALEPQYGGGRDGWLPKSGCAAGRGSAQGFPEAKVRAFEKAVVAPTGDWLKAEGSLTYTHIQMALMTFEIVRLDPKSLVTSRKYLAASTPPYLVWSYLTLDNRRVQARVQAAFRRAGRALATYYRSKGLLAEGAKQAADEGLRELAYGQNCGGTDALPSSFRTLLLNGASLDKIRSFTASGKWRDASAIAAFRTCSYYASMDPLVHVAVARPDVLPFLWAFASREQDAVAQADLDLTLDAEARNAFGKTPLMTAAQFNQASSVRLLLAHGADPNARTNATGTAWARRTPLMYAAANASLSTIKMLLNAGTDPQAADSKGFRALHYLLGYGPVPANPRLSPKDLVEATRLLY